MIPLRRAINIARRGFGLILALIGAMSAMTMVLEPVALAQVNSSWLPVGDLSTPRSSHTATLLPNGKVLVAGGFWDGFGFVATAELYDPATGIVDFHRGP